MGFREKLEYGQAGESKIAQWFRAKGYADTGYGYCVHTEWGAYGRKYPTREEAEESLRKKAERWGWEKE